MKIFLTIIIYINLGIWLILMANPDTPWQSSVVCTIAELSLCLFYDLIYREFYDDDDE